MDAGSEMVLVDLQTLLVIEQALLKLLQKLVRLTQVEEGTRLGPFLGILDLQHQRLLNYFDSFFALLLLDQHLALQEHGFNILRVDIECFLYYLKTSLCILFLLKEYLTQLNFQIDVVMQVLVCVNKVLYPSVNVLPASDQGPAKSELDVAEHILVNTTLAILNIQVQS